MSEKSVRLAQLICSRLCHDLVGPAGAINAGLELAEEGELDEGALGLMALSAGEISRRLAFFRIAFGAASGKASAGGGLSANEARALAEDLLAEGKVAVDWPESADGPDLFSAEAGKVLLLLILICSECLPRGGAITVHSAALDEGLGLALVAKGEGAKIKPDVQVALSTSDVEEEHITARNVHGLLAALIAADAGGRIEPPEESDGEVRLMALFPS